MEKEDKYLKTFGWTVIIIAILYFGARFFQYFAQ
jgi:hypothetical protein